MSPSKNTDSFSANWRDLFKHAATDAVRRLLLLHPELDLTVYEVNGTFTIHIANFDDGAFQSFANDLTSQVVLRDTQSGYLSRFLLMGVAVEDLDDYEAEPSLKGGCHTIPNRH